MGLLLTKVLPPSDTKPPPKTSAHNAVPGAVKPTNFNQNQNGSRRTSKNPKSPLFSQPRIK